MRLRLVVRRHNLPDVAIVWAVEPNENPTISQLLEQVNEIIPLESGGDWGLEDYSVEIKGSGANYECLHFQVVRTILHEDDEVIIRPLLSHDLKLRKVSGRHQISSDGKHLFDGWVFGRPRPRGPIDRPAIDIPPRKRARITYDEETESSLDKNPFTIEGETQFATDPGGNRQLILSADFEDDDEDEDEDFEPDADEDEEEEEEGEDGDDDDSEEDLDRNSGGQHDLAVINGLGDEFDGEEPPGPIQSVGLRSDMQKLQEAFPEAPLSLCKNVLVGYGKDVGKAWDTLSQAFEPSIPRISTKRRSQNQGTHHPASTQSKIKASSRTKISSPSHDKVLEKDIDGDKPSPVDVDSSLLRYYDQHGLPEGSILTGKALSDMAKIVSSNHLGQSDQLKGQNSSRRVSTSTKRSTGSVRFATINSGFNASGLLVEDDSDDSDDEDFDIESSIIDQDIAPDDSSDESSDSNKSESRNGDASSSSKESDTSSSGLTSDSDSESDSDTDQEPEELSSKPSDLEETAAPETTPLAECAIKQQNAQQKADVPPGQGKRSTKRRNQRRRIANLLQRYRDKGILPAGTSVKDVEQLKLDKAQALESALQIGAETRSGGSQKSKQLTEKVAAKAVEFEFRRQQLLNSLASGGVEVGSQLIPESITAASSDSVPKQIDAPEVMPVIEAAELELQLRASVDNNTLGVEAGSAEHDAESLNRAMVTIPGNSSTPSFVAPTGSTTSESVSRPRRKIDLGAAGRMLFGALGVRTPKNKADHEKVRNDLIKDIRPSKPVPAVDTASTVNESSNIGEDPEAWHEVINLRAVECCYDNVELSPAPFPFVQRWDPQQQGGYSMQGNRGGKGKRSKRNQSQYYDYGQQPPKKRKRNRNSYDTYYDTNEQYPAADTSEIEDSFHLDKPIQMESVNASGTQNVYSDGIEGAVNDQIMRDVQDAATSQVVDEDDLPRFPEDITMLPNFTSADVKPGIVIAFKQLILSEATKWQPQISTYRTAVIIRASETGNLELRLAKRDRKQTEKYYDVETGERVYGKFDMPTDDDQNDEEDDGFLEVAIHELVDPKIVQLAPENLVDTASSPATPHDKANISAEDSLTLYHADSAENSKSSVEAEVETPGHQGLPSDNTNSPLTRGGHLSAVDAHKTQLFSVSEDTREEISVLIKEAGFRTSIPSSVLRAQTQLPASPEAAPDKGSYSPKFNGFGSSPESSSSQSIQAISNISNFNPTTPPTEDVHGAPSSSEDRNKLTAPNVQYPKLSLPSSLASQVSDRGRQPDYPIPGDDTLHELDDFDSTFGVHEESPLNRDQGFSSAQPADTGDNPPLNHVKSSPGEYVDSPSSGDLPTLSEVFSTAQSSVGPKLETHQWLSQKTDVKNAKKIEDSYNREMEALDELLEKAEDSEQITPRKSEDHGKKELTAQNISQKTSESQFKIPPGSQQVDLTLSSDGELGVEKENVSDNSYDDNYGLPRGPGWVEKKTRRTRRQTAGNSQASSQRGTKTRSTRRKTMTKF